MFLGVAGILRVPSACAVTSGGKKGELLSRPDAPLERQGSISVMIRSAVQLVLTADIIQRVQLAVVVLILVVAIKESSSIRA